MSILISSVVFDCSIKFHLQIHKELDFIYQIKFKCLKNYTIANRYFVINLILVIKMLQTIRKKYDRLCI